MADGGSGAGLCVSGEAVEPEALSGLMVFLPQNCRK